MSKFQSLKSKVVWNASRVRISNSKRIVRQVRVNDCDLLVFANEDVGRSLWLLNEYEEAETSYYKRTIRSNDICLDVGANIGYFSLLMAKLAFAGEVHVFDPIQLNASMVKLNADLNSVEHIRVNALAVGAEEGFVAFSVSTDSAYSSMHATGRVAESKEISVPVVTLDVYLKQAGIPRVDILKVDVEGAEGLVGDPQRRPRSVLLELYEANLRPFDTTTSQIIHRMISFGYEPFVLEGAALVPYQPSLLVSKYNVIFVAPPRS
jgi:FkbM family methyltransferase